MACSRNGRLRSPRCFYRKLIINRLMEKLFKKKIDIKGKSFQWPQGSCIVNTTYHNKTKLQSLRRIDFHRIQLELSYAMLVFMSTNFEAIGTLKRIASSRSVGSLTSGRSDKEVSHQIKKFSKKLKFLDDRYWKSFTFYGLKYRMIFLSQQQMFRRNHCPSLQSIFCLIIIKFCYNYINQLYGLTSIISILHIACIDY